MAASAAAIVPTPYSSTAIVSVSNSSSSDSGRVSHVGSTGVLAAAKRGECAVVPCHFMDPGASDIYDDGTHSRSSNEAIVRDYELERMGLDRPVRSDTRDFSYGS